MRFEEAYAGWSGGRLTQEEAAQILGVCERSFRRYVVRFEAEGVEGLSDRRLEQASNRLAPVDEVLAITEQYRARHAGWNVRHFHSWYQREGGTRSYSWVKKRLQEGLLVAKAERRGVHRKRRAASPLPGMMVPQDGSTHLWVAAALWDLIVTMDDATNEHYAMAFVEEEGTASSLQGVQAVVESHGLFSSFYSDRGSHYWTTPEAGGKVDKDHPTQFGRAMKQLVRSAGLPYFNPHSFRNTLVRLGQSVCQTPEDFKAWSQNLGHDKVLATFLSYGQVASSRQREIIRGLATRPVAVPANVSDLAKALVREMRDSGVGAGG